MNPLKGPQKMADPNHKMSPALRCSIKTDIPLKKIASPSENIFQKLDTFFRQHGNTMPFFGKDNPEGMKKQRKEKEDGKYVPFQERLTGG